MEIRCYLQRKIDPDAVRVLWALWRLRRIKRKQRPLKLRKIIKILHETPAQYFVPSPTPPKSVCVCAKSLDDVRTYGKMLFLNHTQGETRIKICPKAWAALLADYAYGANGQPLMTSASLMIETVAGTIEVMEDKDKHNG